MSLSSALFSGISGLSTLGNSMTVIGDNIANVNTVGFKGSRVTFQDVLSQTVATTAGSAQVGPEHGCQPHQETYVSQEISLILAHAMACMIALSEE